MLYSGNKLGSVKMLHPKPSADISTFMSLLPIISVIKRSFIDPLSRRFTVTIISTSDSGSIEPSMREKFQISGYFYCWYKEVFQYN